MTTTQIAVRVPTDLVEFADRLVAEGGAKSRAAVLVMALRHEQERVRNERDIAIYDEMAKNPDPELQEWSEWAMTNATKIWDDLD